MFFIKVSSTEEVTFSRKISLLMLKIRTVMVSFQDTKVANILKINLKMAHKTNNNRYNLLPNIKVTQI